MRTIRFGRTNVSIPVVSLGTWGHGGERTSEGQPVGWSGHDDRAAKEALLLAWRKGITHWDTADAYGDGHAEDLIGVAFFSPLKHGLLLGKYSEPQTFPEGDFRSGVADFQNPEAIARYRRAAEEMRRKFTDREEPVLHAVVGALLAGNPTATVLLGQRNPRQTEAASKIGEALSDSDAAWVRAMYRGVAS